MKKIINANPMYNKTDKNSILINTQRSNYKTHTILNKTAGKYDLLLIQEPWIVYIGGGNRGLPAHKAWKLYIPIQSIR
jgi:hypothetical protein